MADELRGRVKTILKKVRTPRQYITKEECKAIGELKRDNNRLVLTADKGVALVVMDKEDYVQKAKELLDQPTYRTIPNDPTTKYKNKLVNLLKAIKTEGEIDKALYKRLYPTGAGSPKFYGLPKIHKGGIPLRPIVSSIGAARYETARELAKILKPLVGKSIYHVHNTQDFIQQIKDIKLQEDQCMVSFDVKALFTSVPIKPAINTIKKLLEEDPQLHKRTSLSVKITTRLLEYCLTSTYLIFQGRFYEQQEGAAIGSPVSPIVANLYKEQFENQAINTAPEPPFFWRSFVDDTFTILQSSHKTSFLEHLNSIDECIQFTSEEAGDGGSILFLDVLIIPDEEGNLKNTVYRKPTHTDLQWVSNHTVSSRYSVLGSLQHRARTICSNNEVLKLKEQHLEEALRRCKYPAWAINKAKMKTKTAANNNKKRKNITSNNIQQPHIVIPYYQGISESMKKTCSEYGVQVYFKAGNTIKNLLMVPKDQDAIQKKRSHLQIPM